VLLPRVAKHSCGAVKRSFNHRIRFETVEPFASVAVLAQFFCLNLIVGNDDASPRLGLVVSGSLTLNDNEVHMKSPFRKSYSISDPHTTLRRPRPAPLAEGRGGFGGGGADLQAFWPAAGAVVHACDFDCCAAHAIGDDIGRPRDHEFARTRHAAGAADFRIFGEQMLRGMEYVQRVFGNSKFAFQD
jgi:hypothetical protein